MNRNISIIIPVYNAFDELQKCVESVMKHTDFTYVNIVFLNDNSPDERIADYLNSLINDYISVYHNEKNYGFSHNVNYGMDVSGDRDVVLLNTDTVVTKGWIEKLNHCAYSDSCIGTVTPFSNSATICSLPVFCQDNQLPEGFTIEEYADIVEKCSMHRYPEIPVAVGFCMYIKRCAIDAVGGFDEETFQRGYGEENDFCNRCQLAGYKHVLCDDTFIYHSGTASFVASEKKKLCEEHEQILKARYPSLEKEKEEFIAQNPLLMLQKNIRLWTAIRPEKKSILYVSHRDFRKEASDCVGGTQLHIRDLKDGLKSKYNVFVLARDREYLNLTLYSGEEEQKMRFYIGAIPVRQQFYSIEIRKILESIVDTFSIDLIHVHHIQDVSADVFEVANSKNIPIYMTIHDFYSICPRTKLLDGDLKLCNAKEYAGERCKKCLESQKWKAEWIPERIEYINIWKSKFEDIFAKCNQLIFPSVNARDIFLEYYPENRNKSKVISHASQWEVENRTCIEVNCTGYFEQIKQEEHGVRVSGWCVWDADETENTEVNLHIYTKKGCDFVYSCNKIEREDVVAATNNSRNLRSGFEVVVPLYAMEEECMLSIVKENKNNIAYMPRERWKGGAVSKKNAHRVAFVGGMTVEKGSRIATQIIKQKKSGIEWFVLGGIGDRELNFLEQKNLTKMGWYRREDIASLIDKYDIDLVCIPAIWPETFCYVLSEAIEANVPVIATDIGALGERIKKDKLGWTVPYGSNAQTYLEKILNILGDKKEYERVKRRLELYRGKTIEQMCQEYSKLYDEVALKEPVYDKPDYAMFVEALVSAGVENANGNPQLAHRITILENELSAIRSTQGYKALEIIRQMRIPCKRRIKTILYAIAKLLKKI